MSHADEVTTDVHRRRVLARAHGDSFTVAWDYPGRTLLEVRVLRSNEHVAHTADAGLDDGQEIVYQDVTGSFHDTALHAGLPYFYTVFARHPGGEWVRWEEYSLPRQPGKGRSVLGRLWDRAMRNRLGLALTLAVVTAGLAMSTAGLLPAASAASGGGASGDGSSTEAKQPAAQAGAAAAAAAAEADPGVAGVLAGTGAELSAAAPWGGTQDRPAGYRLQYGWPAERAKELNDVLPLLRSQSSLPEAPYDSADYRVVAADVSSIQVDVLLDGPQIIQVVPVDGATDFVLHEQTWPPFSSIPWFTARPWILAPVFVVLAVVLMVRAWLRSRAWNRRLPSMTRHDRQFITRLAVLLFLLAGFAWQIYEGWYAATGPTVGSGSASAGSLAALPLLLIPPTLFVAGLVLELSAGPHRGSWALLAVLSGAASAYELAAAMTGVTTNLELSYFVLLGLLCLISIPRAFSAGKMGWSRSASPRYG